MHVRHKQEKQISHDEDSQEIHKAVCTKFHSRNALGGSDELQYTIDTSFGVYERTKKCVNAQNWTFVVCFQCTGVCVIC